MSAQAKPPRTAVLLQLDPELLARLDRFWPAVGHPSRRAAIRHAIEAMLAAHSAQLQRARTMAAEPAPWLTPARVHSADTTAEAAGRPLTADLGALEHLRVGALNAAVARPPSCAVASLAWTKSQPSPARWSSLPATTRGRRAAWS